MSAPEYQINGLADFLSVPPEKLAACLSDFSTWIGLVRDSAKLVAALEAEGMPGLTMSNDRFTWCDDDITGVSAIDFTCGDEHLGRLQFKGATA